MNVELMENETELKLGHMKLLINEAKNFTYIDDLRNNKNTNQNTKDNEKNQNMKSDL